MAGRPELRSDDRASRWSADGWLLWRGKADNPSISGIIPSAYGGSQAGAVVRYAIAPDHPLRPRAYLRATTALSGSPEQELAAGIGIRPLSGAPVEVMGEARAGRFGSDERVRPAALVVFGPPPLPLPHRFAAESYAQAGYVGGTGATAFVDGQLRIDRPVIEAGGITLRGGVGAWGGAQRGAERLDAGPGITASIRVGGKVFARASLDWRQRVAGDAEPGSGPVFTLSTGF